ncbi:hypothetical protein [Limnohabitans sp.]|uniref:hypothetical protein n=1 Tax=Limnohabitans sp. TaxID=1907725 RepID=UPI002AFFD101|nr:hypothetical protein [Limnohabitans sp.]
MKILLLLPFLIFPNFISATTFETAFGIPIGGLLAYKIQSCAATSDQSKRICWINSPRKKDGDLSGSVKYQDFFNLPAWAISAKFWISLNEVGEVDVLEANEIEGNQEEVIANSISLKFGYPSEKYSLGEGRMYEWRKSKLSIKMSCYSKCNVKFISSKLVEERESILNEIQKLEIKRPKTP